MVYSWRFYNYSLDANIVGKALEEIESEHGEVTAKLLLEKARPQNSELHCLFEWNNKEAAERWRLEKAKKIITAIAVTYENDNKEPITVRAFANVGAKNKASFITTATALSNKQSRLVVLQHAIEELQAFRNKYNSLSELSEIFAAITNLEKIG